MNFAIILSEIAEDVPVTTTEAAKTIFGYPIDTVVKFGILILIVAAISVWFIMRPTDEKKKIAQDYLAKMATQVMEIALANISIDLSKQIMVDAVNFDYKTFKEKALAAIKKDSWDFVKTSIKYAVDNNELDPLASRLITEESVNALVDLIMGRTNMEEALRDAYNYLADSTIKEMEEEAEKAKKLAEWAEAQPAESGGPVEDKTVEAFMPSEAPNGVTYDPNATIEVIEGSETTVEIPNNIDPSVDPDTIDDDNDETTRG